MTKKKTEALLDLINHALLYKDAAVRAVALHECRTELMEDLKVKEEQAAAMAPIRGMKVRMGW